MLVSSQFNRLIQEPEFTAVYNTATGNYALLSPAERSALCKSGAAEHSVIDKLVRYGFLVSEEVDEAGAIQQAFWVSKTQSTAPSLVIAPTLGCNFACAYCFETHQKGLMKPAVQEALLSFAEHLAGGEDPSRLHLTWFGGEPLLGIRVIESLTEQLEQRVADGRIGELSHDLCITNGYALTPGVAKTLDRMAIHRLQITLDGPPEYHNTRRFVKMNGRASFDAICANIAALPDSFGKVQIRVNIDRTNQDQGLGIFAALEVAGILDRVQVHFYQVEAYSAHAMQTSSSLMTEAEFSTWFKRTVADGLSQGLPIHATAPRPAIQGVCQVDSQNAFVVHPDGTLYRCYAELGNSGHPVGSVMEPGNWPAMGYAPFQLRDPFDDEECRSCWLLPTCLGSCPLTRNLNRHLGRGKVCPSYKYNFNQLVLNTYGREDRLVIDMSDS